MFKRLLITLVCALVLASAATLSAQEPTRRFRVQAGVQVLSNDPEAQVEGASGGVGRVTFERTWPWVELAFLQQIDARNELVVAVRAPWSEVRIETPGLDAALGVIVPLSLRVGWQHGLLSRGFTKSGPRHLLYVAPVATLGTTTRAEPVRYGTTSVRAHEFRITPGIGLGFGYSFRASERFTIDAGFGYQYSVLLTDESDRTWWAPWSFGFGGSAIF